jgi:membrane fusion protein, multidrug efflux system
MAVDPNQQNTHNQQNALLEDFSPSPQITVETLSSPHPEGGAQPQSTPLPGKGPRARSLRLTYSWLRAHRKTGYAALALLAVLVIALPVLAVQVLGGPPHVTVYSVRYQALTSYVGGGGLTYPVQSLDIAYPVSAQVIDVDVQIGEAVQPGQPLLTLDSAGLTAQLQQAYDEWQTAQSYLDTLINTHAPSTQIAAAQQQAAVAKSRYDTLKAQINSPSFNHGSIVAPFAGVVTQIAVSPGTLFRANTTLLTLQDVSTIIVRAQFPLEQRSQVQVGESVEIDPASIPNQHFSGKVTAVNPALSNSGSATFEAWITVPNPSQALFTGETVYARVHGEQVLPTVPELSVINPESDSIVFLYVNGSAHIQHVVVGARDGDLFGIISGLNDGDEVILVGQHKLSDGEPVIVSAIQN